MSRYVWLAAVALVVATATILFWINRSDSADRSDRSAPPMPTFHELDGGEWHPHPDRAGLPRRRQTQ